MLIEDHQTYVSVCSEGKCKTSFEELDVYINGEVQVDFFFFKSEEINDQYSPIY